MSMHDKLAYIIKHNLAVQKAYRIIMGTVFRVMGSFIKTDEKLILFSAYGGKQYGDSPRVLFEAIQRDERFKDFYAVWAFEHPSSFQIVNAKTVRIDSLQYFLIALKAKIWVTNVNMERGLRFKKRGTIYLNTWHGTGPKKGGNAVKGRQDYDFSNVDIFCCDGEYTKSVFKKYWNAKEESMLMCGRPREDELMTFCMSDKTRVREKLCIPNGKRVLLYMPTWREYGIKELEWRLWKEKLGQEYVMLVRTHHFSRDEDFSYTDDVFFRDVSDYENVNELYLVSDILISDYSSAFFDYGLLGKPMYCYAYDYDKYKDSYGLFIDLKNEFPNGIMLRETDVIDAIKKINYEAECKKIKEYCGAYVSHPVNATQCCLDELYKRLEKDYA